MNNPEGYVLVQVKQLAQWREWANNVAAWSTKADRSSEVARLKASISSAMVSATQPTASAEQAEAPSLPDCGEAGHKEGRCGNASCLRLLDEARNHAYDEEGYTLHPDLADAIEAFDATQPTASNAALCPTCGANTASDNPNQWCACPKTTASTAGEREAFEAKWPMPAYCTWTGAGYAATEYHAWGADDQQKRWEGWQARAALAQREGGGA